MQPSETHSANLLSGRYVLGAVIGEGGSATVYRGLDTRTQSPVAIKVLKPGLGTNAISQERFRREIQITRRLGHPQIVSIYDLITDGERTCLVMEHLEGPSLKDYVRLHAPLGIEETLTILSQILRVLAICHANDVVHRDLKPENVVLLSPAPELLIKVLDFGVSRMTTLGDLTQTGGALGSPAYMAPELFAGNVYDPRTDLYAAGVIAFELLAGRVPFRGDTIPVLCRQHVCDAVPLLADERSDVPAWLQHLVERLLAKHPFERYQSADEALADIGAREVVARAVPQLPRRECPRCHRPTPAALALCTRCGFTVQAAVAPGRFDLRCAAEEDDAKLDAYFWSVFRVHLPPRPPKQTLLLTGLDRQSADLIRRSAQQHGLALIVNRRAQLERLKKSASLVILSAVTLPFLLMLLLPFTVDHFISQLLALLQAAGMATLCAVAIRTYRRQIIRPVFVNPRAFVAAAQAETQWLHTLIKPSDAAVDHNSSLLLSQFIEKYYLLVHGETAGRIAGDVDHRLKEVLRVLAQTAEVLAEIEPLLASAERQDLANEMSLLGERLMFEASPARRRLLERQRAATAERLRRFAALEDDAAALTNRLIRLQYVFNTLLGHALVRRAPLDETALEQLEGAVGALRDDLAVAREVDAELGRLS